MQDLINEAAEVIRHYNPALADAWITDGWRRVDLALAFAAGFKHASVDDDPHPHAAIVLHVAYLLRDARAAAA